MRKLGIFLAVLAIGLCGPLAIGAPSLDGVISTGEWSNIIEDPQTDNPPTTSGDPPVTKNYVEMYRWGAQVYEDNGVDYLYWFCEIKENYTDFQGTDPGSGKTKKIFPSLWIDADASTGTYLSDSSSPGYENCADNGKKEWATNHRGIDINVELGLIGDWTSGVTINTPPNGDGEGPGDSQYNYWGDNDDVATDPVTGVSGGQWYLTDHVMEARIILSDLTAKIESLPDFNGEGKANVGNYFMVAVSVQGTNRTDYDYGYDVGTPIPLAKDGSAVRVGDANLNDYVDDDDLSLLLANWNTTDPATWKMGDFNYTTEVDDDDLSLLLANWNQGTPPTGAPAPTLTPEPTTLSLLSFGVLAMIRRRK
jgi:hypothetical protein